MTTIPTVLYSVLAVMRQVTSHFGQRPSGEWGVSQRWPKHTAGPFYFSPFLPCIEIEYDIIEYEYS